jgi:hypothetical protein
MSDVFPLGIHGILHRGQLDTVQLLRVSVIRQT